MDKTETEQTKKVAINKCFGGFGLSEAAQRALIGQCSHISLMEPGEYYGNSEGWEKRFAEDQSNPNRQQLGVGPIVHEGLIVVDEHRSDAARECPALVAVIERLGEAAEGRCAELAIVEIPAGVEYEISEYDGREHIAEQHRTWY